MGKYSAIKTQRQLAFQGEREGTSHESAMNKNKNTRDLHRGRNEFTKGYQPRSNLVKDENGDIADYYNILNRSKNYSHLLNVHTVGDVYYSINLVW
jgi:hypothetical protein